MPSFLYRTEAKGIQSWILESDRLLELRGGSNIIVRLEEDIKDLAKRCGAEVWVAAAGGATLEFKDIDGLRSFAAHWPLFVSQRAPGLQVLQAWGETMEEVRDKLGEARNRLFPDLPAAGPLVARSGRTGLPAVRRGVKKDGLEDKVIKTKLAQEQDELHRKLLGDEEREFIQNADHFEEGYIAVIHIDGNGVGQKIIDFKDDIDGLKQFSENLRGATEAAARDAFAELVRRHSEEEKKIQARPIVLGGDDLTVIVHGQYAIPFTVFYLRAFEEKTAIFRSLTACAGIALVKSGWPFSHAHSLAEDLCKSAKRLLERKSGLLFHRVTTSDADLRWDHLIKSELKSKTGEVLAGGPWRLEDLPKLDALCDAASQMPRGGLRGWVGESRVSSERAQARWERLREVAEEGGTWKKFQDALLALGVDINTGWQNGRTPIPDALMWVNLQPATGTMSRLWST